MRYELSDSEWAAIKPLLPNKSRGESASVLEVAVVVDTQDAAWAGGDSLRRGVRCRDRVCCRCRLLHNLGRMPLLLGNRGWFLA